MVRFAMVGMVPNAAGGLSRSVRDAVSALPLRRFQSATLASFSVVALGDTALMALDPAETVGAVRAAGAEAWVVAGAVSLPLQTANDGAGIGWFTTVSCAGDVARRITGAPAGQPGPGYSECELVRSVR